MQREVGAVIFQGLEARGGNLENSGEKMSRFFSERHVKKAHHVRKNICDHLRAFLLFMASI